MIVYPIKWVPYILIIGGIGTIFLEGDVEWGLCLVGIGIAWMVIKKKYFDSGNNTQKTQSTNTQNTNFQNTNMNHSNTTTTQNFCTNCGSKIQPGDLFCENCGKKING